jgi:hypothetical protein
LYWTDTHFFIKTPRISDVKGTTKKAEALEFFVYPNLPLTSLLFCDICYMQLNFVPLAVWNLPKNLPVALAPCNHNPPPPLLQPIKTRALPCASIHLEILKCSLTHNNMSAAASSVNIRVFGEKPISAGQALSFSGKHIPYQRPTTQCPSKQEPKWVLSQDGTRFKQSGCERIQVHAR